MKVRYTLVAQAYSIFPTESSALLKSQRLKLYSTRAPSNLTIPTKHTSTFRKELRSANMATAYTFLKDLVLLNPVVTGPLLYILTRGPEHVRDALLRGIHIDAISSILHSTNATALTRSVKVLKWLFAVGAISKINRTLTNLALNHWSFSKQGEPWDFQSGGEIICITGGSSGFGALMVKEFAEKVNVKIVVIDVQDFPKDLAALRNVHFYKCDLTQPSQIDEVTRKIKAEVGDPSVLINNAGIGKSSLIIDSTPEWIEKIFRVNIISHWQTVAAFLPAMLKKRKGHVVTIASMATFVSVSNIADYAATKAGLLAFHEGLNQELKHRYENGHCIQTTIVHPNFARTPLVTTGMANSGAGKSQESQLLPPEMISNKVVKQVLDGSSAQIFVPSNTARISGLRGWPTWMQEVLRDLTARITQS
ncbi:hypothetical protein R6Q59_010177 [Mikania micrantha]